MGNRISTEPNHGSSNSHNLEPNPSGSVDLQIEESSTSYSMPNGCKDGMEENNMVISSYSYFVVEWIHSRLYSLYKLWISF